MKKWYAIQTYSGSELKVAEDLNERVMETGLENGIESFYVDDKDTYFLVPVEEVITSRSRRGVGSEYRVPYEYELVVQPNERIRRGQIIARKAPKHIDEDVKVVDLERLQRVIVEMTNRNEEEYILPAEKRIRRDIRAGQKIRNGVPLTTDGDEAFIAANKGKVLVREKVRRITLKYPDGKEKSRLIPEKYLCKLRKGTVLSKGDKIEKEDKISSRASGLLKSKEYKDKRIVTVQRIEKRRLFPGYVFARMRLDIEGMMELISGVRGAVRYVGSYNRPAPISGPEMKVVKRKVGLLESPVAASDEPKIEVDFDVGEVVEIIEGPFADFTGEIKEIDKELEEITVMVKIFGRDTPVRLGFEGIDKL